MNKKTLYLKPKISVIMGNYNSKKYLKLAISSVLRQTFKNFEFIIVDDASTDGCQKIIKEFASKDRRIKYFFLKKNSGKDSVPRNFAIKKAKSDYVAFIDSDDVWEKDKLEIQNSQIKKDTIMLCTSCTYINMIGSKYSNIFMHYFRKYLQSFFFNFNPVSFYVYNPVIFSSVMIKKKIIKQYKFNEHDSHVGVVDLELWLRIFTNNKNFRNIVFINKDLVQIRRRNDSLNRNYRRASIRNTHCLTNHFIKTKDYRYFYYFVIGVILRALKTILNYSYYKFRRYILTSFFLIISSYILIFQTPLFWHLGNYLIYYDNFEKKDALVIISGNGSSNYINLEYQKRFLDIKEIINNYDYENIIILGRYQELKEVEILASLIVSEGVDKKNITTINDNLSTYNNVLTINKVLEKKNISRINLITSPYHTNRSKMIWKKNTKIELNIIENKDNPFNYKFGKKIFSLERIRVILYEHLSYIYNKLLNQAD
jgi:teichuronic acid biosynthesis glycosyltransferase TuaG